MRKKLKNPNNPYGDGKFSNFKLKMYDYRNPIIASSDYLNTK